jgi:tetratricopeptide (TPR) repeat protein
MVWGPLKQLFISESERRFNAIVQKASPGAYNDAIALELEYLSRDPRTSRRLAESARSLAATFYVGTADQRLRQRLTFPGISESEEILAAVRELRESEAKGERASDADRRLNKAFNGSLSMYGAAAHLGDPTGCRQTALNLVHVADWALLRLYGVSSPRIGKRRYDSDRRPVHHGDILLGHSLRTDVRDIEFADELKWLYEEAKTWFWQAINMDPTDTKSLIARSALLRQFGQTQEALSDLDKALAVLNRALQADESDKDSYSERAAVFEQLGQMGQVLADLERVLALTTSEFEAQSVRERIDTLRKSSAT